MRQQKCKCRDLRGGYGSNMEKLTFCAFTDAIIQKPSTLF